jgi:hypothetical protein
MDVGASSQHQLISPFEQTIAVTLCLFHKIPAPKGLVSKQAAGFHPKFKINSWPESRP